MSHSYLINYNIYMLPFIAEKCHMRMRNILNNFLFILKQYKVIQLNKIGKHVEQLFKRQKLCSILRSPPQMSNQCIMINKKIKTITRLLKQMLWIFFLLFSTQNKDVT